MDKKRELKQIWVNVVDIDRLDKLGRHDNRSVRGDVITVIIDEACQSRGLDPVTMELICKIEN